MLGFPTEEDTSVSGASQVACLLVGRVRLVLGQTHSSIDGKTLTTPFEWMRRPGDDGRGRAVQGPTSIQHGPPTAGLEREAGLAPTTC